MDLLIPDSCLLMEVIKRKPIYDTQMDEKIRDQSWEDLVNAIAVPTSSRAEKLKLELYARSRWEYLRNELMNYLSKFYDLISEVIGRGLIESSFRTKALIYRYMCTRVSNLVKVFMLNEPELDEFQMFFEGHLQKFDFNICLRAMQQDKKTDTELRRELSGDPSFEQNELFFTELRKELFKLPVEARPQMQNNILKLVRGEITINEDKAVISESLIRDLMKTLGNQHAILNRQFEELDKLDTNKDVDQGEPQPGPSSKSYYPPSLDPSEIKHLKCAQQSLMSQIIPFMKSLAHDLGEAYTGPEVNVRKTQPNAGRRDPNDKPPSYQECGSSVVINRIPIPAGSGNSTNPKRKSPFIRRNEHNFEVHMCDEFVISLANSVLYCKLRDLVRPNNATQSDNAQASAEPKFEANVNDSRPSCDPPVHDQRTANENSSPTNSRESQSPIGNISPILFIEPRRRDDSPPDDPNAIRNLYRRADDPNTSNGNYTL